MANAIMRNLPDGRYELYCHSCDASLIPKLPISLAVFVQRVRQFEADHNHDDACRWEHDGNWFWEADCGLSWGLADGTPIENEMVYCPRCGRQITAVWSEEEE